MLPESVRIRTCVKQGRVKLVWYCTLAKLKILNFKQIYVSQEAAFLLFLHCLNEKQAIVDDWELISK